MSNIDPGIPDPGNRKSPEVIVPDTEPDDDAVGSNAVREPGEGGPDILPDPEEGNRPVPDDIRHA